MRPLLICALIALVVGCGGDDEQAASSSPSLEGTPWVLTGGIDVAGWETVAPSATFQDGKLAGSSGCNRYFASYTLDGSKLTLGPAGSTKRACGAPADAVEAAFQAALRRVAAWRVADGELTLLDGDDGELLRFRAASPIGAWEATAFLQGDAVSSPITGTKVTAIFEEGGKLTGSAGCNDYSATFVLEPFAISGVFNTEMACQSPAGVMEQEQAYLTALPKAASYSVEGSTLTLLTREGTIVATYTRTP